VTSSGVIGGTVAGGTAPGTVTGSAGTDGAGRGRPVPVTWRLSPHARRLLTLAAAGLILAVSTGRPVFAGIAAPALLLLAGWRVRRPGRITVAVRLSAQQLVEGERAAVVTTIGGHGDLEAQVTLAAADGFVPGPAARSAPAGRSGPAARAEPGGSDRESPDTARAGSARGDLRVPFQAERWGTRRVGRAEITLRDRLRLFEGRAWVELPRIDTHPLPAPLRSRVVLSRLPSRLGEHPSRAIGEGIEFAGVREFVPGDRQRRINWPATTRSGKLQLNTFTAERTQNVVVLADATASVGPPGVTSLDLAFRAAAGTINCYLASGDRVGLIVYADRLSWIGPGLGRRHFHRLMDLLLASQRGGDRTTGLTRLPKAALPPGALILVFSPLLHPRLVEALRDLRERGFAVLVVDVLTSGPPRSRDRAGELARRIWRLEQDSIRFSLTELGIPVVRWDGQQSLDEPLAPYTRRVMLAGRT
jgi:uncharacterized protein (DUF58 family)